MSDTTTGIREVETCHDCGCDICSAGDLRYDQIHKGESYCADCIVDALLTTITGQAAEIERYKAQHQLDVQYVETINKSVDYMKTLSPWVSIDEFESNVPDDRVDVLIMGGGLSLPTVAHRFQGRWFFGFSHLILLRGCCRLLKSLSCGNHQSIRHPL